MSQAFLQGGCRTTSRPGTVLSWLARYLGTSSEFRMHMQARFDLEVAERTAVRHFNLPQQAHDLLNPPMLPCIADPPFLHHLKVENADGENQSGAAETVAATTRTTVQFRTWTLAHPAPDLGA